MTEKIDMIYDVVKRTELKVDGLTTTAANHETRLALLEDRNKNGDPWGVVAQRATWVTQLLGLGKIAAATAVLFWAFSKVSP